MCVTNNLPTSPNPKPYPPQWKLVHYLAGEDQKRRLKPKATAEKAINADLGPKESSDANAYRIDQANSVPHYSFVSPISLRGDEFG
jgi:hypothetical protein